MTPKQFRDTRQWKDTRKRLLANAGSCTDCGRETTRAYGTRHSFAPSLDHILPLHAIDLSTVEGRRIACDPKNLRVLCIGCNSKRGQQTRRVGRRRVGRRAKRPANFGPGPQNWGPTPPPQRVNSRDWLGVADKTPSVHSLGDAAKKLEPIGSTGDLSAAIPPRPSGRGLFDVGMGMGAPVMGHILGGGQ